MYQRREGHFRKALNGLQRIRFPRLPFHGCPPHPDQSKNKKLGGAFLFIRHHLSLALALASLFPASFIDIDSCNCCVERLSQPFRKDEEGYDLGTVQIDLKGPTLVHNALRARPNDRDRTKAVTRAQVIGTPESTASCCTRTKECRGVHRNAGLASFTQDTIVRHHTWMSRSTASPTQGPSATIAIG